MYDHITYIKSESSYAVKYNSCQKDEHLSLVVCCSAFYYVSNIMATLQ